MNVQEALARIKEHRDIHFHNELNAIYITEALDMAIEALEKQIPKKPLYEKTYGDCAVYSCPVCKDETMILNGDNYCTMCGQKLDWGGDDDEM